MSIVKNLGKLRQWTNEKLGNVGRTEVTEDFKALERRVELRREAHEGLWAVVEKYVKTLEPKKFVGSGISEKVTAQSALGLCMNKVAISLQNESQYRKRLLCASDLEAKLGCLSLAHLQNIRVGFYVGIEEYMIEARKYLEIKKKLESRRLDYDAKLAKVQKSKKEKPELEEEVRAAQLKYEETLQDLEQRMHWLLDYEEKGLQNVESLITTQLNYHYHSLETLKTLADSWNITPKSPSSFLNSDATLPSNSNPSLPSNGRPLVNSSSAQSIHSLDTAESPMAPSPTNLPRTTRPARPPPRSSNGQPSTPTINRTSNASFNGVAVMPGVSMLGSNTYSSPISQPDPPLPAKKTVIAQYDFTGQNEQELDLKKGDILHVLEEIDAGWWIGELDGKKGMFPSNYTTCIEPTPVTTSHTGRSSYSTASMSSALPNLTMQPLVESVNGSSNPIPEASTYSSYQSTPSMSRSSSVQFNGSSMASPTVPPKSLSSQSLEPNRSYLGANFSRGPSLTSLSEIQPVCSTCGCDDYFANVFKPGNCNNCFHKHA